MIQRTYSLEIPEQDLTDNPQVILQIFGQEIVISSEQIKLYRAYRKQLERAREALEAGETKGLSLEIMPCPFIFQVLTQEEDKGPIPELN